MFRISSELIEPAHLRSTLLNEGVGAFVAFEGWVRNHNDGMEVSALDYEAFVPLAEKEGERILLEAQGKFSIIRAAGVHRIGSLRIGDLAIWVGVVAAHRGAAFDSCRFIIDQAKARLPIWKREHYVGGASNWINCATIGSYKNMER